MRKRAGTIVQVEINAAPAWCLDNGLVTRDRSAAHRWPSYKDAEVYVAVHLDPKTPRELIEVYG